jgi:septum formation protein
MRRAAGEAIDECVQRLARSKALQVQQRFPSLPVLGADTVVVVDEVLLGKPRDRADGLEMLRRLSGRSHQVLSAVALASATRLQQALSRSVVRFRALTEQECADYWDSGEPHGKAGAYAIQGRGAVFVEYLSGSYSGVMGLPLYETAQLLHFAGIDIAGVTPR